VVSGDTDEPVREWLAARDDANQWRVRRCLTTPQGPLIEIGGKPLINFCSNDYLGLANHPAITAAFKRGVDEYGVGSGASQLICGHSKVHAELEEQLAVFTGRERALVFSNGYMANLAVISAFAGRADHVIGDRLNHASLIDGARLSGARFRRYPHADCRGLERILSSVKGGHILVVTDSVFSMDGDLAPLPEIAGICRQHGARLMVDDAHGFGVLGKTGAGALEAFEIDSAAVSILMGTFGKALGGYGAFVAGDADIVEYLIQAARPYIYTTALPPALAVAAAESLRLIREEPDRSEYLYSLIDHYKQTVSELGLPAYASSTPIQPLILGEAGRALQISEALREAGYYVAPIRPPTVPSATSRLRITLSASHSREQVDGLLETVSTLMRQGA